MLQIVLKFSTLAATVGSIFLGITAGMQAKTAKRPMAALACLLLVLVLFVALFRQVTQLFSAEECSCHADKVEGETKTPLFESKSEAQVATSAKFDGPSTGKLEKMV